MSGPRLGRPPKENQKTPREEYQDNVDRIEVERFFSLDKRCYGAGLIMTKLPETTLPSIAMSVLVGNLFRIPTGSFFALFCGFKGRIRVSALSGVSRLRFQGILKVKNAF